MSTRFWPIQLAVQQAPADGYDPKGEQKFRVVAYEGDPGKTPCEECVIVALVREVQVPSGSRPAWVGVAAAGLLAERKVVGLESYGVELTRGYGGDPWVDVLEELADAVAYAACSDDRWLKEFLLSVLCDVVWARGR